MSRARWFAAAVIASILLALGYIALWYDSYPQKAEREGRAWVAAHRPLAFEEPYEDGPALFV